MAAVKSAFSGSPRRLTSSANGTSIKVTHSGDPCSNALAPPVNPASGVCCLDSFNMLACSLGIIENRAADMRLGKCAVWQRDSNVLLHARQTVPDHGKCNRLFQRGAQIA